MYAFLMLKSALLPDDLVLSLGSLIARARAIFCSYCHVIGTRTYLGIGMGKSAIGFKENPNGSVIVNVQLAEIKKEKFRRQNSVTRALEEIKIYHMTSTSLPQLEKIGVAVSDRSIDRGSMVNFWFF